MGSFGAKYSCQLECAHGKLVSCVIYPSRTLILSIPHYDRVSGCLGLQQTHSLHCAKVRPPWGSVKLIFTNFILNPVSLEQFHHKPMFGEDKLYRPMFGEDKLY